MRAAGDVGYSNVERTRDGPVGAAALCLTPLGQGTYHTSLLSALSGVVEYHSQEDLDRAIQKLDGSAFK